MTTKRPFDGPDAHCSERGGDDENVTADDTDVGELAKRLRISTLACEEDPEHRTEATMAVASSSAPAASNAPAEQRMYVCSWAYWWNYIEGAWNEGYVAVEGNWCRPDRQYLWDTLWWWDMGNARWSTFQGWRVNPYYVPGAVAVEQSR
jgi:hypothetical protein